MDNYDGDEKVAFKLKGEDCTQTGREDSSAPSASRGAERKMWAERGKHLGKILQWRKAREAMRKKERETKQETE